jgi:antitoxin CptB
MLELDLFLLPFFDQCYAELSPALQVDFYHLLAEQDPEIYQWLMGYKIPVASQLLAIVEKIKAFKCDGIKA